MYRVLFVDDEPSQLSTLRDMLSHQSHKWSMTFVNGGELALHAMLQKRFDVVVTDMRMTGMDGDVLLREVHRLHPDTFRVVLCGYAGAQATSRLMEFAQEHLMKPCIPADLVNAIERGCAVRRPNLSALTVSRAQETHCPLLEGAASVAAE